MSAKVRLATVWLDGCSGCHMSLLDMDERLLDVADRIELVSSPLMDVKGVPEHIDLTIIEGAITNEEDLHKVLAFRKNTKLLMALGDCAITGNVPAMRNTFAIDDLYNRAYIENADTEKQVPGAVVPALLDRTRPIHEVVKVDIYVPGCPPHADIIFYAIAELLEGRMPDPVKMGKFG
ncbi:MAG TPA: NADP oxidoreductase [Kiritimatiellia bacterium]|nr:NADP oxidoreductase [Kiritimatiellia bacterium]